MTEHLCTSCTRHRDPKVKKVSGSGARHQVHSISGKCYKRAKGMYSGGTRNDLGEVKEDFKEKQS